eukprot:TRINITY_DN3711_c0_g1_i3.p2 TRINITY_DN3711_c0_g1~~TRINITY_DN3711_c0_g1_i3.p2  ORF type:complete len:282 (+),score=39.63 TRINITY_DN3711_c0_g1_i3:100-945(+)
MRLGTFTLAVLCFLIVFGATEELRGLDISIHSGLVPLETFQCLKDSGYDFIIIQVWNGGRQLNKNIKDNVERAWKAGFKYVDLYSFAANNCTNNTPAERPIEEIHEFLTQNNVKYGRLWVDVEPCKGCWLNDLGSNFQYVLRQVVKAQALGIDVHIYSQKVCWYQTVGVFTHPKLSQLKLWYARYDGKEDFNDAYYNFGGWTQPYMKQIKGSTQMCGLDVDISWTPNYQRYSQAGCSHFKFDNCCIHLDELSQHMFRRLHGVVYSFQSVFNTFNLVLRQSS